jgi:hypothetical protein
MDAEGQSRIGTKCIPDEAESKRMVAVNKAYGIRRGVGKARRLMGFRMHLSYGIKTADCHMYVPNCNTEHLPKIKEWAAANCGNYNRIITS